MRGESWWGCDAVAGLLCGSWIRQTYLIYGFSLGRICLFGMVAASFLRE